MYGTDWSPERCGKVSSACLAHFVAENCAYECDVNWGRYRHHAVECGGKKPSGGNTWQISGLPISVSI
jgi:hypothetical protein